jgi:hypothetical protein
MINLSEKFNEEKQKKQMKKVGVSLKMDLEQKEYLSYIAINEQLSLSKTIILILDNYIKYAKNIHKNQKKLPL